jgi:hypothetical protein
MPRLSTSAFYLAIGLKIDDSSDVPNYDRWVVLLPLSSPSAVTRFFLSRNPASFTPSPPAPAPVARSRVSPTICESSQPHCLVTACLLPHLILSHHTGWSAWRRNRMRGVTVCCWRRHLPIELSLTLSLGTNSYSAPAASVVSAYPCSISSTIPPLPLCF